MKQLIQEFEKRGIVVIGKPLIYCSGALYFYKRKWFCVVNSSRPLTHQRFTLAHELYHYDYHRGLSTLFTDFGSDSWLEREANRGAAEMLMPEDQIRVFYNSLHELSQTKEHKIKILAHVFGVSLRAMEIRFEELGL